MFIYICSIWVQFAINTTRDGCILIFQTRLRRFVKCPLVSASRLHLVHLIWIQGCHDEKSILFEWITFDDYSKLSWPDLWIVQPWWKLLRCVPFEVKSFADRDSRTWKRKAFVVSNLIWFDWCFRICGMNLRNVFFLLQLSGISHSYVGFKTLSMSLESKSRIFVTLDEWIFAECFEWIEVCILMSWLEIMPIWIDSSEGFVKWNAMEYQWFGWISKYEINSVKWPDFPSGSWFLYEQCNAQF
jgi:hypothetical protein